MHCPDSAVAGSAVARRPAAAAVAPPAGPGRRGRLPKFKKSSRLQRPVFLLDAALPTGSTLAVAHRALVKVKRFCRNAQPVISACAQRCDFGASSQIRALEL
jgi:hypothetical protein